MKRLRWYALCACVGIILAWPAGYVVGTLSYAFTHPAEAQTAPVAPVPSMDVCLKITGTRAEARAALRTLGLDREMLRKREDGSETIVGYNRHVAIDFWRHPILKFGTYTTDADGNTVEVTPPVISRRPILRIRILSKRARQKARLKLLGEFTLSTIPGLEKVPCPTTRVWSMMIYFDISFA